MSQRRASTARSNQKLHPPVLHQHRQQMIPLNLISLRGTTIPSTTCQGSSDDWNMKGLDLLPPRLQPPLPAQLRAQHLEDHPQHLPPRVLHLHTRLRLPQNPQHTSQKALKLLPPQHRLQALVPTRRGLPRVNRPVTLPADDPHHKDPSVRPPRTCHWHSHPSRDARAPRPPYQTPRPLLPRLHCHNRHRHQPQRNPHRHHKTNPSPPHLQRTPVRHQVSPLQRPHHLAHLLPNLPRPCRHRHRHSPCRLRPPPLNRQRSKARR